MESDFEVCVRVWLQNNNEIVNDVLDNIRTMSSYKSIIEGIIQGDSKVDQSFQVVSIYISRGLLPQAELDDLIIFPECIRQQDFDNIPYVFWLIFHFLYLGAAQEGRGELSDEAFRSGRDKIIKFFVDRSMAHDLVLDYFIQGVLEYHSMVRKVFRKID